MDLPRGWRNRWRSGSSHHGQDPDYGVYSLTHCHSLYPFEYSKTRVQLLQESAVRTSSPIKLILQVAREEGVGSLYTGCSTLVIVGSLLAF